MTALSTYQVKAPELDGLGYRTIPCEGKRPIPKGWQTHPPECLEFHRYNGTTNVGILTGGEHNLVAVDVDVRDVSTAREIEILLKDNLGEAPRRIGQAPKCLYVFQCVSRIKKRATDIHMIGGQKSQVEVLGEGQQFISHGVHPETKEEYVWPKDDLTDYKVVDLTVVTEDELIEFLRQADSVLSRKADFVFKAPPTSNHVDRCVWLEQLTNVKAWHDPMLHLTSRYVAKGMSKEEIITLLEAHTWADFTIEQTRKELSEMIDSAVKKEFAPKEVEQPTGKMWTLQEIKAMEIVIKPPLHPWLSSGCMLLAGRPKAGKSLLAEHISYEVAKTHRVLFLALEYNMLLVKSRFRRHMQNQSVMENFRLLAEGNIPKFDQGGDEQLESHLDEFKPHLIVIDTIQQFKRPGEAKGYEGETIAMREVRALANRYKADSLFLHHTRKKMINDEADVFDQILGSTALSAVPDTLMVLEGTAPPLSTLHVKGRLLLEPRDIVIELQDGEFVERTEAGASLIGKADVKGRILNLLEAKGPLLQKEIASLLELKESNVSGYCKALSYDQKIRRGQQGEPWELVPKEPILEGV